MARDTLTPLQAAQKASQARAKETAKEAEIAPVDDGLDAAEAVVQLAVAAYAYGATFGMGALPDGSGIYGRVRIPGKADHPCAGMVAFVVSDDPIQVMRKALAALASSPRSNFWKPDQFAQK